jgi:hypothetical protein
MVGEEEGTRIEFHQDFTLGDSGELEDQDGVLVAKASEEASLQEEGRHAIRAAFCDLGQFEQEAARGRDRDSAWRSLAGARFGCHLAAAT